MSRPIDGGLGHVHGVPTRLGQTVEDLDRGDPDGVHLHVYKPPGTTRVKVLIHHHARAPQAVRWLKPLPLEVVADPDWWPEGDWT